MGLNMQINTINDYPIFALKPGCIIDNRYEIQSLLGIGGFGITYKAFDYKLSGYVAIKEYFPQQYAERKIPEAVVTARAGENSRKYSEGLIRFKQEAERTAKLNGRHNVVNIIGYAEQYSTAYLIMELLEGKTLNEYMKTLPNERFDNIEDASQIIYSVVEALEFIHKNNMLHRDISPDNIFLCLDGSVKLIDFGAAREFTNDTELSVVVKSGCTPPEQYRSNGKQGTWTDIYALGATFYRMLTGVYPDPATDRQRKDTSELQPPSSFNPSIPEYLDLLLARCLALDYHLRIGSAIEIKIVLDSKRMVSSVEQTYKKRKALLLTSYILATLCVLMIAVIGIVIYLQNHTLENISLKECTLYVEVPEYFSTESGLREAEEYFEAMYEMVDVKIYYSSEMGNNTPAVFPKGKHLNPASLDKLRKIRPIGDQYSEIIAFDPSILYINMLKLKRNNIGFLEDIPNTAITEEYDLFLNNETPFWAYRSGVYDYKKIQSDLPLLYKVCENMNTTVSVIEFCVSDDLSINEKNAALRFLLYLSEESAQEILFIQNEGMIPANDVIYEKYYEIIGANHEFDFIKKYID